MSKIAKRLDTELTCRLDALGITQSYLGDLLGRTSRYVAQKLNKEQYQGNSKKRHCWTLDEAWQIMEILNAPDEDFLLLFPPEEKKKKKGRAA